MSYGDIPSILSESQSRAGVRCATCGLILAHGASTCPSCLTVLCSHQWESEEMVTWLQGLAHQLGRGRKHDKLCDAAYMIRKFQRAALSAAPAEGQTNDQWVPGVDSRAADAGRLDASCQSGNNGTVGSIPTVSRPRSESTPPAAPSQGEPSPQTPAETEVRDAGLRLALTAAQAEIERQQARIAELERAAVPREPTEAMQAAGIEAMFDDGGDVKKRELYLMIRKAWRAMYDAAMRAKRGKA